MPLYIAIPGFFVCACLGYVATCMCIASGEASRREDEALVEARRQQYRAAL